jgi:hypothetical protein
MNMLPLLNQGVELHFRAACGPDSSAYLYSLSKRASAGFLARFKYRFPDQLQGRFLRPIAESTPRQLALTSLGTSAGTIAKA